MMEQLVKHLAVRLWTTAVVGSIAILVLLHPFAGSMGPDWMIVPALGLLGMVFWLVGVVFAGMGGELTSKRIGEEVMRRLKGLDEVAYVRFASVYRQFRDINEFMNELEGILKTRKEDAAE